MDELDGVPCKVLGYRITTRTQICLSCCVTAALELLVYVLVIVADFCVVHQHFHDLNTRYAVLTLGFLLLPAIGCFCSILVSPWQWPDIETDNRNEEVLEMVKFFGRQSLNLIFFPIAAVYRYICFFFYTEFVCDSFI